MAQCPLRAIVFPVKFSVATVALVERPNVGDEPPDLVVGDAPAPRRHAVGTALVDGLEDLARAFHRSASGRRRGSAPIAPEPSAPWQSMQLYDDEQLAAFGDLRCALPSYGLVSDERPAAGEPGLDVVGMRDEIRRLRSGRAPAAAAPARRRTVARATSPSTAMVSGT